MQQSYYSWLTKVHRCFLMTIRTLTLLLTSPPQHLSHIHQLDAHAHADGMALPTQTVSPESTRPNSLRQTHTILLTLSISSHPPQY